MIILGTHVWVWWISEPDKLSSRALVAINYAKAIGISPISCWEIATKVAKGRLALDRPIRMWVQQALAHPGVILMELSASNGAWPLPWRRVLLSKVRSSKAPN